MATNADKLERGKRVRIVRNMADLTIDDFAAKIGVSNRTIKYWENGEAGGLNEKGAEKIINAGKSIGLQCSTIWLLYGAGSQPILVGEPYNKSFALTSNLNDDSDQTIKKEIRYFHSNNSNAITMQITGNGMEPYFCAGDIVGGKRKQGKDLEKALHQDCIIETKNQKIFCRRLLPGSKPNLFTLCCTNQKTSEPFIITDVAIISAAPIIWMRRQER